MKILHFKKLGFLLIACAVIAFSSNGFAAGTPVGKVLMTVGEASAKAGAESRALQRRSDIFVGDVLITGAASQMQIRMNDGALIALGADAEFAVKTYRFNEAGKKDEVVLAVIKGGLRTITGQVEKSGYRMTTPVATLGIRGTIFEVHVGADGTTTVILRDGGVDVTGQVGEKVKLDLANLVSIIRQGEAAGKSGEISEEVLKYLQSILPSPANGASLESDGAGGYVYTIDVDPGEILRDPATGLPPPGTSGNGEPPVADRCVLSSCDPCVIDPSSCDPCVVNPTSCM